MSQGLAEHQSCGEEKLRQRGTQRSQAAPTQRGSQRKKDPDTFPVLHRPQAAPPTPWLSPTESREDEGAQLLPSLKSGGTEGWDEVASPPGTGTDIGGVPTAGLLGVSRCFTPVTLPNPDHPLSDSRPGLGCLI